MSGGKHFEFPIELESQFILRLPEEPAKALKEVIQSGATLKDRLNIQIENDMRYGQVRFDHWLMHAKIVDLPAIIESLKTIDNKSFYKTADICQMMVCKMEPEPIPPEEENITKNKKKDPYKVDKKFLYPHGVTPPTKNVRKRRFRKTLKKKYVEAPEIEKEVKRLLRSDNDAVNVTWEVITEDVDHSKQDQSSITVKSDKKLKGEPKSLKGDISTDPEISNVDDIFGGAVSDSDLEDDNINVEMEDTSRLSADNSRLSDSSSMPGTSSMFKSKMPTQFRSDMFQSPRTKFRDGSEPQTPTMSAGHSRSVTPAGHSSFSKNMSSEDESEYTPTITKESIMLRMEQLSAELDELRERKQRTQHEIVNMDNQALRQRFQDILQKLQEEIIYKEIEYQDLQNLQQQTED